MNNLDYGIIGNCRSAALVSKTGSIDWCCLPEFDSPSVFGKLLDKKIGGSFEILVDESYKIEQRYKANTAILITQFSDGENSFEIYDFMPRYYKEDGGYYAPPEIIRYVMIKSGKPRFRVKYHPKLNYAKGETESYLKKDFIASLSKNGRFDTVFLYSSLAKEKILAGEELELTEDAFFSISYNEKIFLPTVANSYLDFERTKVYWLNWCSKTPNYTSYNEEITRSSITLKLLSYDKSGAVLAAATTSLPETIGEVRNWDYRFCWIRDASMVIKVVSQLGHENVARRYLKFIIDCVPDKAEKLQIMYGINGERKLTERELEHLKEIWNDIYESAWNEEVQAYTQSYGSKYLDASVLMMEAYGCVGAKDERFVKTVHAIEKELSHNGLLYRYKNEDDFGLPSSSFTVCSFWFVNALIKIGERKKARELFDKLLSYSNHLGLFSEDIDFETKRLLGNFPQAYSHLALIECAINFSKKERDEEIWESMN